MKQEYKNAIFNGFFGLAVLLVVILFYENIWLSTLLLGLISIVGLLKWRSWLTFSIFIFAGFFGSIAEIIAVYFSVWSYSVISIINVPLWLFLVWADAGVFIYQTSIEIKKILKIKK
jgi:hypothetical protein